MLDFQAIIDQLEDEAPAQRDVAYTHRYAPRNREEQRLKTLCGDIVSAFCTEFNIELDGVKLIRKTESYGHCSADSYHFYRNRVSGRFTLQLQQVNSVKELVELLVSLFTRKLTWSVGGEKITPFPVLNLISGEARLAAELGGYSAEARWTREWLDEHFPA